MGLQNENKINGASVLVIDQACDNDQLLVSLSKNEAQWLSPVGWTDQQKVTLLDCRPNGEITEIDIPAEFARDIKTGDILVLRCSELDIEREIIWEASSVETRSTVETIPTATSLAGGLLSRFKGVKAEPAEEVKSEAELRAEEADRAAQVYKAKMEAATAAKEDAQRKALEAAREAEAALKMEAERIAEMERAAKAFEEAERLKQDELRRVDEERRAEEARLAEEARRIEEARKREIATQKEAERKVALEGYEAELNIIRGEELRLKSRLENLKSKAKSETANTTIQAEDLKSRQGLLVNTKETNSKRFNSYESSASKLDVITAELTMLETTSETLGADRQALSIRLSQADADYQLAQSEAEAAMTRAEARRAELDIIRGEERDISSKMSTVTEKLASQSLLAAEASEKTQKLQLKYETAQADLAQVNAEIVVLEQALAVQGDADQNLRLEIEATQQAVEDSQAREAAYRDAIEHLQAGGALDDIAEVDFQARNYEPSSIDFAAEDIDIAVPTADINAPKESMLGRVRRSFAREKEAEISIDVEDVVLEGTDVDPVILAGIDDTPSFVRRHGSSLMALGAFIGGLAILSGGYALNQSTKPTLSVKSSMPAPKQVLSAVTKIEMPKVSDLEVKDIVKETADVVPVQAAPIAIELPKIETIEVEALATPESVTEEAILASEVVESTLVVKLAEVIDPSGFAFELPDMMPRQQAKKVEIAKAKAPKIAEVKKIKPVITPKPKIVENYPELTSNVQTRLSNLGFYAGEISGVQGEATKESIINFKTHFAMTETNSKISGAFLTKLKRAEREREVAKVKASEVAKPEAQAAIQVAEAAPSVDFYDTVQAVPTAPVITDSLSVVEVTPTYIAPEPETVKVASIPAIVEPAPTPVAKDVIVEAKIIKNASAKYPSIALRKNYFTNVAIVINYDIDAEGRSTNLQISSNDHDGRYNEFFEREALKAVKKMRFDPRTINGVATETTGNQKRIVFRTE